VIDGFAALIADENIPCDVVAGVEAAGIPHSAALGFRIGKPSVFVRKQAKEHGMKKLVEGGDVTGRHIVLVEDLVTTGGSSLAAVEQLRAEGAIVNDCLAIVSYGFAEAAEKFAAANVKLHTLTTFSEVLDAASAAGRVSQADAAEVRTWFGNPRGWRPTEAAR
jgi:orotate phosphoribosyltransferase